MGYNPDNIPYLFPAYAGMNRNSPQPRLHLKTVPRLRGDEPVGGTVRAVPTLCSPPTRG